MKLANERGGELSLADLDLIRGGAGIRFFHSDTELARLGRAVQQYVSGLLRPAGRPRPALLELGQAQDDAAFDSSETDVQALRQLAR
jgi:hypothetical protein